MASLTASKLLDDTVNKKIREHLAQMMELRSKREQLDKKVDSSAFYYQPQKGKLLVNKKAGDEVPPVNLSVLGLQP